MTFRSTYLTKLAGDPRRNGRTIWETTAPVKFRVVAGGEYVLRTIPTGFQSDLVSPPNFPLSLLTFPLGLHNEDLDEPSLVHDWMYQNLQYTKEVADAVLARRMKYAGINWFRRFWINLYVRNRKTRVQWGQPKLTPITDPSGTIIGWMTLTKNR